MALVKFISLKKSNAIYGREGRYTYYLELDTESPTIYTAYVTRFNTTVTYWTLAIMTPHAQLVLKRNFRTKKAAMTYLRCDFDSADHAKQIEWK